MLAYVFWHQREQQIAREEYQEKLVRFQQVLQTRQASGFIFSLVLEMVQLPWMLQESEVYEDWYIVENSAALDVLDEAAVTGTCREPHQQVARLASYGTGGLYRLKSDAIDPIQLSTLRFATWFNKPAAMSYNKLYELLHAQQNASYSILWQRQMTMGPALEFCLHSAERCVLVEEIKNIQVEAQPLFVPGR